MRTRVVMSLFAAVLMLPSAAGAQQGEARVERVSGRLEAGDQRLESGEYNDTFTVEIAEGQTIVADLTSTEFDPYVGIRDPDGGATENDDYEGSSTRARVELICSQTGTWTVVVTSYEPGESGAYELVITISAAPEGARVMSGSLERGDGLLDDGEYFDQYPLAGKKGEWLVLDLRSEEFDPYLILQTPSGEQFENDDHEGSAERSMLAMELTEDGEYTIGVTTYEAGEEGHYTLLVQQQGAESKADVGETRRQGRLESSDRQLRGGEYADDYDFIGRPGQLVRISLQSPDFDAYLIVNGPGEVHLENDDDPDQIFSLDSAIETVLTEPGTYKIVVTSADAEETGAYDLVLSMGETTGTGSGQRDSQAISVGQPVNGSLSSGDQQVAGEGYQDLYVFQGREGQNLRIDLESGEFDTFLGLVLPSGDEVDNDDFEGSLNHSRIEMELRQTGRYRVIARSYDEDAVGSYTLSVNEAAASASPSTPAARPTGSRVFGIFVGISDYGGRANNLRWTAEDAHRVANAMMRGAGMLESNSIVLTDQAATADAVRNAIGQMGSRVGPQDTFIFFYSGHGGREQRSEFQQADPDAIDETIALYDDDILDDEFALLLDQVDARVSLIALDSCFSGGFSKDIISVPGRMGLFSSEEDVTSSVARKFQAGGFLAKFIADAVGDRLADSDGDGGVSALELSEYLHDQFRFEVKSSGLSDYVETGEGPAMRYQHLVVDRGSISPFEIIFP